MSILNRIFLYFMRAVEYPVILVVLICLPVFTGAQIDYQPIQEYGRNKNLLKPFYDRVKLREKNVAVSSRKNKKEFKSRSKEIVNNFIDLDTSGALMFTDTLTGYTRKIFNQIINANPVLKGQQYTFCIQRSSVPNAYSSGDGMIRMNIDFVARHDNEAQFAFILCHELAHDYLKHVLDGMVASIEIFNSSEYKRELNTAKYSDYNSYKKSMAVFNKYLSKYMEHSRGNELEADSLGLIFFENSGYNAAEAVLQITLLDSCDRAIYDAPLDLKQIFNFKNYPFDESWLQNDPTAASWEGTKWWEIPDSLKTHPNCPERATAMQRIIKNREIAPGGKLNSPEYDYFRKIASFELLEVMLEENQISMALYQALQLKRVYPESAYLNSFIVRATYLIYEAQLRHRFTAAVEFPHQTFTPGYNQFLKFLHNQNSTTLGNISKNYYKDFIAPLNLQDAYSRYVSILVSGIGKKAAEMEAGIKSYESKFGKNKYYVFLLQHFPNKKKR